MNCLFSLLNLSIHDEGYSINRFLHKHVMCTKFDIYVFIKERKNLTCNHPPIIYIYILRGAWPLIIYVTNLWIKYYCVAKNTIEQCTTDVNSTEANHLILNNIGTINIGSALFNSVFSNAIIFYSKVCYIYNERPRSSQNIYILYSTTMTCYL
jgi:hypothetical protein